jgi:hypothetical protein
MRTGDVEDIGWWWCRLSRASVGFVIDVVGIFMVTIGAFHGFKERICPVCVTG